MGVVIREMMQVRAKAGVLLEVSRALHCCTGSAGAWFANRLSNVRSLTAEGFLVMQQSVWNDSESVRIPS